MTQQEKKKVSAVLLKNPSSTSGPLEAKSQIQGSTSHKSSRHTTNGSVKASLYVEPTPIVDDWPEHHNSHQATVSSLDQLESLDLNGTNSTTKADGYQASSSSSSKKKNKSGQKPNSKQQQQHPDSQKSISFSLHTAPKNPLNQSYRKKNIPHLYESFVPAKNNANSYHQPNMPFKQPALVSAFPSASQDPTTGLYVTSLYVSKGLSASTDLEESSLDFDTNKPPIATASSGSQAVRIKAPDGSDVPSFHVKLEKSGDDFSNQENASNWEFVAESNAVTQMGKEMENLSLEQEPWPISTSPTPANKNRDQSLENKKDLVSPTSEGAAASSPRSQFKDEKKKGKIMARLNVVASGVSSTQESVTVKEKVLPKSKVQVKLIKSKVETKITVSASSAFQIPPPATPSSSHHQVPETPRGRKGRKDKKSKPENDVESDLSKTPRTDGDWRRKSAVDDSKRKSQKFNDVSQSSPFKSPNKGRSAKEPLFDEYFSLEEVEKGLEEGILHMGKIRINKTNRNEAYVTCTESKLSDDVYIPKTRFQNRAFDGDVVIVQLLDGTELEKEMQIEKDRKERKMAEGHERQKKCEIEEIESPELFEHTETRIFGRVVYIHETNADSRVFVGTLMMDRYQTSTENGTSESETITRRWVWFKPNDKRVPLISIPRETAPKEFIENPDEFKTILVTAAVTKWSATSRSPFGEYLGKLGQMGEIAVESKALLTAAGITWDDFHDDELACLPQTPWSIPESEYANRLDVRKDRIFSIDPPTARDLDDALSCKELPDGNMEIGVHIADVSFFVKPDTALDREAKFRATTVYLVQKAIPMLPRLLCEELCSLNPGVDRLAFSVFWTFSPDGDIIGEPRFARTIIRSCAKLSYDHAQAIIDNRSWDDLPPVTISNGVTKAQVDHDVLNLYKLSLILRKKRYDGGAISFHSIKLWFALDDVGNPVSTGVYEIKDSNRLVEEFMLLANMAVAHKISATFPDCALLRRHQPPVSRSLAQFIEEARSRGFDLDPSTSATLNDSFERIENPLHRYLLRLLCIKSMKRAEYFCTGIVDISEYFHYALSVPLYTHFTSPIRRYCDVIVHRLLDLAIRGETSTDYNTKTVGQIAKQCNIRKDMAREGQDASQRLFLCAYLSRLQNLPPYCDNPLPGVVAFAHINSIGARSFDVVCDSFGIEKRVWVEDTMSVDTSLVGCKSFDQNHQLALFWRRRDGDTEPSDSFNISAAEVSGSSDENSDNNGETVSVEKVTSSATAGMDPKSTKVQVLRMFSRVQVRIVTNMQTTPPEYKLYAVYPEQAVLERHSDTDERVLYEKNPMLEEQSAVCIDSCPAIEFTAD